MPIRASSETKLLDAADELFFTRGIAATPIDAVLERAGVSAATMYRGFESKEALVAATLERRHLAWLAVWDRAVERAADDREALLAVFGAMQEFRRGREGARWCAFLASAAEYADPPGEIARAVSLDTESLKARLERLADPIVGLAAAALADELVLLVSGGLAMRLRDPDHDPSIARRIAETLIDRHGRLL